jgi:hypothetical protein
LRTKTPPWEIGSLLLEVLSHLVKGQPRCVAFSIIPAVPCLAEEPTDNIETVPATALRKVAVKELLFHRGHQLPVPTALHLNDHRDPVQLSAPRLAGDGIDLDVCLLALADSFPRARRISTSRFGTTAA